MPEDEAAARLRRLERLVKYQWIVVLIAMAAVLVLAVWQAQSTAREAARAQLQIQLLRDLQNDFGRFEGLAEDASTQELYGELRRSVNEVRRTYEQLGNWDPNDLDASLDALFGPGYDESPKPDEAPRRDQPPRPDDQP